jgi:hypothetical protein
MEMGGIWTKAVHLREIRPQVLLKKSEEVGKM